MMQFSQPPPPLPNMSGPPPNHNMGGHNFHPKFGGGEKQRFYQPYRPYPRPGADAAEFDGKRLRKSIMRKTVDYNSAVIRMIENRVWQRDWRDRRALQPDMCYVPEFLPPSAYPENPSNAITTRFVKTATNKMRCPVFCLAWTPEGRRLVTGASSGEFTLWNGLTFNFETILQAHDSPVRTMVWSHNDVWMVTGDHGGYVKYWQSNMNNVKMFQAHKEALRGISFSPNDQKFATCSDDGTIRIWDFLRCQEERILRGHGADVKCIHWHPHKGLIISGSKDNQQPVKLWDPKTGQSLATLHAHKSTVMDVRWNDNGNWLVTASRDHLLKLFDVRNLSTEIQTFRGHKKEASAVAWHPTHEGLFCSGGSDGAILFWHVGADKEIGGIEQAHDSIVWSLAWHPMGHILCSGSNDHTSKFWTRNRPGDQMRDKYNLNTLPAGASGYDDNEIDDLQALIPGMGPEDRVESGINNSFIGTSDPSVIPGLDFDPLTDSLKPTKKVPYAKPIPKNFQAHWNETKGRMDDEDEEGGSRPRRGLTEEQMTEVIANFIASNPPPGVLPLADVQAESIIIFNKLLTVEPDSALAIAISGGARAIEELVESGEVPELTEALRQLEEQVEDDDDDANLELRPEEHESYDGDMDNQYDDNFCEPWSEQDEMNFANFDDYNCGPNMGGPGNFGGPNMDGPPGNFNNFGPNNGPGNFGGNFGPGGPNNFGPNNFCGPGNFGPNMGGGNFGPPGGNFGPGGPGNFGGPGGNFGPGPNMGGNFQGPQNAGNFGGPNMGPNSGPGNFGGPNMGPGPNSGPGNFGGPNMGPGPNSGPGNFGGPNMGPGPNSGPGNFGGPNMGPGPNSGPGNFGGPNMGPGPNSGPGNFGGPNMGPGPNSGPGNFGGPNMGPGGPNMGSGGNFGPNCNDNFGPGNFGGPGFGPAGRSNFQRGGRGGRGNDFRGGPRGRGGGGDDGWNRPPWEQQGGGGNSGNEWGPNSDNNNRGGGNWGPNRGGSDAGGGNWQGGMSGGDMGGDSFRGGRGGGRGGDMGGDGNWRGGRGGAGGDNNWRGGRGGGDGPPGNWRGGSDGGNNWRGNRGGGPGGNRGGSFNRRGAGRSGPGNRGNRGGPN